MPDRRWWQSPISYLAPLFVASFLFAAWLVSAATRATPRVSTVDAERAPPAEAAHATPRAADAHGGDPAALVRTAVPALPAVPQPTFAERIDELVRLGQRTAALAQQDDTVAATASDGEARVRFADLLGAFADAGERAIDLLLTLPDGALDGDLYGRRLVLQLVLTAECERRQHDAAAPEGRARLDALVHALLTVMPGTASTAEVGERVLADQRYLRLVHEPDVLALVRLAATGGFPRPVATRLLLTLWDNLQASGERSSDELSRLALLLLADSDASQRTAACRQLLHDARYRGLVLAWLRERGDQAVAQELAGIAARELPVADALAVLRELSGMLPRATNAYLLLGFRAPDAIADGYRELLAANTHANVRCDLVTGVGMTRTPLGRELAELALHSDPATEVRLQAVFALTAHGDAAAGERALMVALDDPRIAQHPLHAGALVLALQNLEAAGDVNAVDRVAQRLQTAALAAGDRELLASILRRCLPGPTAAPPGAMQPGAMR